MLYLSHSHYSSLDDDEFEAILRGEKDLDELCPNTGTPAGPKEKR